MKIVGLTGGIATGKTTVHTWHSFNHSAQISNHIRDTLGIPVVDADKIARDVVQIGEPAYEDIVRHFGQEVLLPSGKQTIWLTRAHTCRRSE